MHKNVENVLERDRKLGDLEERADALQDGCAQFEKQVRRTCNGGIEKTAIMQIFGYFLYLIKQIL